MKGVAFVQHVKLHDVKGRQKYIGSEEKQEHLYAKYDTAPAEFWEELAKENRQDFRLKGTSGQCIEARELIIALPKKFYLYDHDELLKVFVDRYKERYGVECSAALHHNKKKTNLHIHLIYSEREKLSEPIQKIATRRRYYDPEGKHLRTAKEAKDKSGKLLPGYTVIEKGEVYEEHLFEKKKQVFKSKAFTEEIKEFFVELMNTQLSDREKLSVFPKGTPYMPTKKIGKNNPRAEEIKETNVLREEWNRQVNNARKRGVPKESLMFVKRELVMTPIKRSEEKRVREKRPNVFRDVLAFAVKVLRTMNKEVDRADQETWASAWGDAIMDFMNFCMDKVMKQGPDRQTQKEKYKKEKLELR